LNAQLPFVVIKNTSKKDAYARHAMSKIVRKLCKKLANIVVPDNIVCGEYLVETRYPILSRRKAYDEYWENEKDFDAAVLDMIAFFNNGYLGDLISPNSGSYDIRFDNLGIHRTPSGKIQIALVDLEHFDVEETTWDKRKLSELVAIFPLHLKFILDNSLSLKLSCGENKAIQSIAMDSRRNYDLKTTRGAFRKWLLSHPVISFPVTLPKLLRKEFMSDVAFEIESEVTREKIVDFVVPWVNFQLHRFGLLIWNDKFYDYKGISVYYPILEKDQYLLLFKLVGKYLQYLKDSDMIYDFMSLYDKNVVIWPSIETVKKHKNDMRKRSDRVYVFRYNIPYLVYTKTR
jgi:hypothetical protein